jgi:hypothetical protein
MHDLMLPVLDALPARVDVFIRDDDAGWDDNHQLALLDVTRGCGAPIDLAAIPRAMSAGLARVLRERIAAAQDQLGIHQHGSTHFNHESAGRKCEFGGSRSAQQQREDLSRGQALLRERFGELLLPVFTPPWNRCTEDTPLLLAELGFTALSRDRGAKPAQHALQELAVDVDWSKHWRGGGAPALAAAFALALRERAADGQPFGLMLHHAVMNRDELTALEQVLLVLARHPRVRWRSMRQLLAPMNTKQQRTVCTPCA